MSKKKSTSEVKGVKSSPRTRAFMVVTYEDEKEIRENLHKVRLWAEIVHDSCVDDMGEPLKPHYHTVIYFSDAKTATAAAVAVGLAGEENRLQHCSSLRWAVRYLPHLDEPEKHHYPIENVTASFDVSRYLLPKTEKDAIEVKNVSSLMEYITLSGCVSMEDLFSFAVENGFYSELRRGQGLFRQILYERRNRDLSLADRAVFDKIEKLVLNSAYDYNQGVLPGE